MLCASSITMKQVSLRRQVGQASVGWILLSSESRQFMLISNFLQILFFSAQIFFSIATTLIAASSLDDLFGEALLLLHYRSGSIGPDHRHKPIWQKNIVTHAEKPLAILLPAWEEIKLLTRSFLHTNHSVTYKSSQLPISLRVSWIHLAAVLRNLALHITGAGRSSSSFFMILWMKLSISI